MLKKGEIFTFFIFFFLEESSRASLGKKIKIWVHENFRNFFLENLDLGSYFSVFSILNSFGVISSFEDEMKSGKCR